MKILVSYRGIPQSPGWATGDMVVRALRRLGHDALPYAKIYEQDHWLEPPSELIKEEYDLLLFMECNDGDSQYGELKNVRARQTACWLFDTSYHGDRYTRLVQHFGFDHIFLANPLTIREYNQWGYQNVNYLPYACDRELHARPLEHPKTRDVALIGSIRDDRVAFAREARRSGLEIELVGNVFREDYVDALASTKIIVNQNPHSGRGLLNMRYFEAPAAGAFVLTEEEDYAVQPIVEDEGLGKLLSPSRLCYPYNSPAEVAGYCKGILETPQVLNDFRRIVQTATLKYHSYDNRCETLLETVFPYEASRTTL